MNALGRGTRRELALAARALEVARSHLKNARCGMKGDEDEVAARIMVGAYWDIAWLCAKAAPMRLTKPRTK